MSDQFWNGFWTAIGPLMAIIVSHLINRSKLNAVATNVHKIELATNSMKDQLVEATRVAGELKGGVDEPARADAKVDIHDELIQRTQRKPGLFNSESGIVPRKASEP